ncbi:hypothetical protein ACQ859_08710 [Roseateles chitinivorans]
MSSPTDFPDTVPEAPPALPPLAMGRDLPLRRGRSSTARNAARPCAT